MRSGSDSSGFGCRHHVLVFEAAEPGQGLTIMASKRRRRRMIRYSITYSGFREGVRLGDRIHRRYVVFCSTLQKCHLLQGILTSLLLSTCTSANTSSSLCFLGHHVSMTALPRSRDVSRTKAQVKSKHHCGEGCLVLPNACKGMPPRTLASLSARL